jgi:hypothetical protein
MATMTVCHFPRVQTGGCEEAVILFSSIAHAEKGRQVIENRNANSQSGAIYVTDKDVFEFG